MAKQKLPKLRRPHADRRFPTQLGIPLRYRFRSKTTILCAEAVPWRCHRQLIADALLGLKRIRVLHILGPDRLQDHRLTPFAKVQAEGTIHYPEVQSSLFPEPSGVRGIEE